jgi:CheY-like chemotaxis protein
MLQALLMSNDDEAAQVLMEVLAPFGLAVARMDTSEAALARLTEESFDLLVVDFDNPEVASSILETCRHLSGPVRHPPVTLAMVRDAGKIRTILGAGSHFVLIKPLTHERAERTLRAATAILKREQRQSATVAVQAPVEIRVENDMIEGIVLEISTSGMDILAAKPLPTSALVGVFFDLPDGAVRMEAQAEVQWSIGNGQSGLRFLDMESKLREKMGEWLTTHSQDAVLEDNDPATPCELTDLSLSGCYVHTESPFPQSSAVDLCLRAAEMEIHAEGLVRVMHPGHGMGIELPSRTVEQRRSIGEFIDFLSSQRGMQPQLQISPRALVASAVDLSHSSADGNMEDPLLTLLRSGSTMNEEEFLTELASQRTTSAASHA